MLEITGGEPLLSADYIRDFLTEYPYPVMLETNGTLPKQMKKLRNVIDIVSLDIKLPEHFNTQEEWQNAYNKELTTIKLLEKSEIEYYIKFVVLPTTSKETITSICEDLEDICSFDVEIIIQPVSPMSQWKDKSLLFELSEAVGQMFPVSVIPQVHKYMDIE